MPEENNKKEEWTQEETEKENGAIKPIELYRGYSPFEIGRRLKFGEGNNTIKIDVLQGLWAGNQVYAQAPFQISSRGSIERFILKNRLSLPTTCLIGELAVSMGTLYICSAANNWSVVGRQT